MCIVNTTIKNIKELQATRVKKIKRFIFLFLQESFYWKMFKGSCLIIEGWVDVMHTFCTNKSFAYI